MATGLENGRLGGGGRWCRVCFDAAARTVNGGGGLDMEI